MPKGSKSSASSATRKKHAKKANAGNEADNSSTKPTRTKPSKKQIKQGLVPPPKKVFIPPSKLKPAPPQPDPLDSVVSLLPPDLVLVLRKLSKKDTVTKTRALEELEAWIKNAKTEMKDPGSAMIEALVVMLPVWLYRFPALSVHPSRRLRQLSATLHASFMSIPAVRQSIVIFQRETGSETAISHVLGVWCLSAWDVDRITSQRATRCWLDAVEFPQEIAVEDDSRIMLDDATLTTYIIPFLITTIMDPASMFVALVPPTAGDSAASSRLGTPVQNKQGRHGVTSIRKALERDSPGPSRTEDDPESVEDRNARLRTSGLGALTWILASCNPSTLSSSLHHLLSSSLFWSVLNCELMPSFFHTHIETDGDPTFHISETTHGLGVGQPAVRRAGWTVISALLGGPTGSGYLRLTSWLEKEGQADSVSIIATAVLRSAFVEFDPIVQGSMWEPLLLFLTKFHDAWLFSRGTVPLKKGVTSEEHYDETFSDGSSHQGDPIPEEGQEANEQFKAYSEFLTFLSLGCNGRPLQGYPTVLIIMSTIPEEILPMTTSSLSGFFDALWSAIDGQAFSSLSSERSKATEAFLGSWGECLTWVAGKLVKGTVKGEGTDAPDNSPKETALALVEFQFMKFTGELLHGIQIDPGGKMAKALTSLEGISSDLLDTAWSRITSYMTGAIISSTESPQVSHTYVLTFLASLRRGFREGSVVMHKLLALIQELGRDLATRCQAENAVRASDTVVLQMLLVTFGDVLKTDPTFLDIVSGLLRIKLPHLLSEASSVVLSYLQLTKDLGIWQHVLFTIGCSENLAIMKKFEIMRLLIEYPGLEEWAKPMGSELQALAQQVLDEALTGNEQASEVVVKLLRRPGPFVSLDAAYELIGNIVTTLDFHIQPVLRSSGASTPESIAILRHSLRILLDLIDQLPSELPEAVQSETMPRLFVLSYIVPQCDISPEERGVVDLARRLWEGYKGTKGHSHVKHMLKEMIIQTDVRFSPIPILDSLTTLDPSILPMDILPNQAEFLALFSTTSADALDPTLAIIEPLVPPSLSNHARASWNSKFDGIGFSPYARASRALLHLFSTDRYLARINIWGLQHILTLALFSNETLQLPGAENPVFVGNRSDKELKEILRATQKVAAFLLASAGEDNWHRNVVMALSPKGKERAGKLDMVGELVKLVFEQAKAQDTVRDSMVLYTVLQHILPSTSKEDADGWIELVRELAGQAHQTSLAIVLAVSKFSPEPPKLDRYRNELASKISGVPPSKANTEGYRLLRSLNVAAPDSESDVIFLPQQRVIFLVQALQSWMGSDEDIDEAVEIEVTKILTDLAPILLGLPGAHWEFIMDLIESNIENCSFKDSGTLLLLSRTMRLVSVVMDLATTNKYLREIWAEPSKSILTMIRDLLLIPIPRTMLSLPRAICREQVMTIIQGLPGSLMDESTLSKMCHLITDPSVENQKMAYHMLQHAASRRTEHLVVEAGVDNENTLVIELPKELLDILQTVVKLDDSEGQDPLAYLLAWLLVFDLFSDTSLKVKMAYVEQIRNLDLVGTYLLPNLIDILGVGSPLGAFNLAPWSVDEYWLTTYDEDAPPSLQLLAAHVYYRALLTLPSLIRTWWEDLKDRQLSSAVSTFTSAHFSPVLIASEFGYFKPDNKDAEAEPLTDDTFSVKIATATSEVTATFNVDEQQMEIGVKLPSGYPLRTVEVRLVRRLGVNEKVWRRWLFAVQQVITAHNGRIVDALALFKKTVSLHFEGQVECAICYSILHVADRSLPSKPCKTCKNRFHAGCLYKWFNTSHSSSCPLCRSDIM